jgi:hypothetical protein
MVMQLFKGGCHCGAIDFSFEGGPDEAIQLVGGIYGHRKTSSRSS